MQEQGKVVSVNGKIATVEVDKKDECSKCGMCLFPQNAKSVTFEVKNTLCAKVGDIVTFNTQKQGNLLGAILVFLIPLILIGLSAIITYFFIKIEIWMLILSVIFIILWYTILAVIDKKLKNNINILGEMISIEQKGEQNEWRSYRNF